MVYFIADISQLRPIKEQLPDSIDWWHIKVVIAILQVKFGVPVEAGSSSSQPAAPRNPYTQGLSQFARGTSTPGRSSPQLQVRHLGAGGRGHSGTLLYTCMN